MDLMKWPRQGAGTLLALWLSAWPHKTPRTAKAIGLFVIVYVASPVDWTAELTPMPSYLDDLRLLAALSWLAMRLLPESAWHECRRQADAWVEVCAQWADRASMALMLVFAPSMVAAWLWLWFVA